MMNRIISTRPLFIAGLAGASLVVVAAVYFPLAAIVGLPPFSGGGPLPANIEILLDRSAAMEEPFEEGTKLSEAVRAIKQTTLVEDVAEGDFLALRQYGGPCQSDNTHLLVEFNQNNRRLVEAELEKIISGGESSLARGILEGIGDFRAVGNGRNAVIAITGRGGSCEPEVVATLIRHNAQGSGGPVELQVIVIGASGEVPPPWTDEEGVFWVENWTELVEALGRIIEQGRDEDEEGDGEGAQAANPTPPSLGPVAGPTRGGPGSPRGPDGPNGDPRPAPVRPVELEDLYSLPADQPFLPVDLNGLWEDEKGRTIRITQTGSLVFAQFVEEPFVCEHRDGTGRQSQTDINFTAILQGDRLSGSITVCNWGEGHPYGVGIGANPFQVSISQGGKELSGAWRNLLTRADEPASLTRLGCSPLLPQDLGLPEDSPVLDYFGFPVAGATPGAANEKYHMGLHFFSQDSTGIPARRTFTAGVSGVVDLVADSPWNTINVHLDNGNIMQYLHASRVDVSEGRVVRPDTVLGLTARFGVEEDLGVEGPRSGLLHVQARNAEGAFIHPDCARP